MIVEESKPPAVEFGPIIVPIQTFAPEPFDLLHEIKVVIQQSGDEFLASFFDANVNAQGANESEALENLKENILSRFEYLSSQPTESLSKPLQKQIAVLREFVRSREVLPAKVGDAKGSLGD